MLQGLIPLPVLVAALIVGTDRRIVGELRRAGATTVDAAIELRSSLIRRFRLRRLSGLGAIRVAAGNRYYLDEAGWARYRRVRRTRVLAVALALSVCGAALWLRLL